MSQAGTNNPPRFVTLWSIHDVHWMGTNPTLPPGLGTACMWSPCRAALCRDIAVSKPLLPSFDQWGTLNKSKLRNHSSLFTGLAADTRSLWARGPYTVAEILFWEKHPWVQAAVPNKCLAFHIDQLSDQSRVYLGHSQSLPISSPSSTRLFPNFSGTVPVSDCCPSLRTKVLIVSTPPMLKLRPRKAKWFVSSGIVIYNRQVILKCRSLYS